MTNPRDYAEKRGFNRMALNDCPLTYRVQGNEEVHEGVAQNLSSSGIHMVCDRELEPGTLLEVKITPAMTVVAPLEALVEVVRVQAVNGGCFEVGAAIKGFLGIGDQT